MSAARKLVAQARAAGYRAPLLTVDSAVRSKRERELRHGIALPTRNSPSPRCSAPPAPGLDLALPDLAPWGSPTCAMHGPTSRRRLTQMFDGTVSWADLDWIRQEWTAPSPSRGL
jgi:L-lactate dehydrogenase (cytochrome)